jgi:F-type H+-transporting ATPase subunit delta
MPLLDLPSDALSKVYAEALFEMAEAEGGRERLESLAGELDELVELTRAEAQLSEFMASQIVAKKDRERSLREIFGGRVSDLLLNFLLVLNHKERLNLLLPIVTSYQELVQERFGRVEIDVFTRFALSQEAVERIRGRLQEAMQREPVLHAYTDEEMIGGVRMRVGDKLIDGSIATRLRRMRDLLTSEGAALMGTRYERAFEDGGGESGGGAD